MTDLQTEINQLEDESYYDYVMARSEVDSDAKGYKQAEIAKGKFYGWDKETRDYLNDLAFRLKRATGLKAKLILSAASEKAAIVKTEGLDSRKEHIKQAASTEILDRNLGKPTQRTEHTGKGGQPIEVIEIVKNDGTLPSK